MRSMGVPKARPRFKEVPYHMPQDSTLQLIGLSPSHPRTHRLGAGAPSMLGRAADCDVVLADDSISRRHALITYRSGAWFVVPQATKGPSRLNGVALPPDAPAPLKTGDLLQLGPLLFRVATGADASRPLETMDDDGGGGGGGGRDSSSARVERAGASGGTAGRPPPTTLADQRLRVLVATLDRLTQTTDPEAIARLVADAAVAGSGYARAAVLRRLDASGQVALVASSGDAGAFRFSRALIDQASAGHSAVMTMRQRDSQSAYSRSIAELEIHSALCAPVQVAGALVGYVYLDARGRESAVQRDAAGFCEALATAYAFALGESNRAELQRRQRDLAMELAAAREVQQLIVPPGSGRVGPVRYAVRINPGLFVAGDFFDVFALDGDRVAICMGDVSGHGIGPALLMAATQSYLHADLLRHGDPVQAVSAVNAFAAPRFSGGRFASAFVGVLEPTGELNFIDAGHGHWLVRTAAGQTRKPKLPNHIPIGIEADHCYSSVRIQLDAGERLVLYSDGIFEQRSTTGVPFGLDRLAQSLAATRDPDEDVRGVFDSLQTYCGTGPLDDDATAASLALCD